jgi:C1A family cysteine protease
MAFVIPIFMRRINMPAFGLKSLVDPMTDTVEKLLPDLALVPNLPPVVSYTYIYPPVDDQGPFGTCVAFGTKKVFEFFFRKRKGQSVLVSATGIYSAAKSEYYPGDKTDDGLQVSDGLNILKQFYVLDKDLPYKTDNFSECLRPVPETIQHKDFLVEDFVAVNPVIDEMRTALYKHGPLAIGTSWANEWMNPDSTGRLQGSNLTSAGGHCVAIVGYRDEFVNLDGSKGAFEIINNWTAQWGYNGFAFIPYNSEVLPNTIFTIKA